MIDSTKISDDAIPAKDPKVLNSDNGASSEGSEAELVMPAIVDRIAEISARVPMSNWRAAPTDGAENLKHYLYGWPKDESKGKDSDT